MKTTKEIAQAVEQMGSALRHVSMQERFETALQAVAAAGGVIGYGQLGKVVGVFSGSKKFTELLAEQMRRDKANGGPLYCALVCNRTDSQPSQGFFDMASSLGFTWSDPVQFWIAQRDACYAALS